MKGGRRGPGQTLTILDDRGFKVWGYAPIVKVPVRIGGRIAARERVDWYKGDRITMEAWVTASDTDPTFGFFKRPIATVMTASGVGTPSVAERLKISQRRFDAELQKLAARSRAARQSPNS